MAGYGVKRLLDYYYAEEKRGPGPEASLMAPPKEGSPKVDRESFEFNKSDPYAFLGRYAQALRSAFNTEEEFVRRYEKRDTSSTPDLSQRVVELQKVQQIGGSLTGDRVVPEDQPIEPINTYFNEDYFPTPKRPDLPEFEAYEAPKGLFTRPTANVRPKLKPGSYTPDFELNVPEDAMKDKPFLNEVSRVSKKLNIKEEDLLKAIQFETAGSFDPAQPAGTSNAVGLIQFMPKTAEGLGTTTAELSKMSRAQQMKYVDKHLSMFLKDKDKEYDFGDLYMAIHWPAAVGKSNDYVMYSEGSKNYSANKGLDINKDGKVTKGESVYRALESK